MKDGKYIPQEFSTRAEALEGAHQGPLSPQEPGMSLTSRAVANRRSTPQGQSSNLSVAPEHASSPKIRPAVVPYRHNAATRVVRRPNAAASKFLPHVETTSSSLFSASSVDGESSSTFAPAPLAWSSGTRSTLYTPTHHIYQTTPRSASPCQRGSVVEPDGVEVAADSQIVAETESNETIRKELATTDTRESNVSHRLEDDTTSRTVREITEKPLGHRISEQGKRLESWIDRSLTDSCDCEDNCHCENGCHCGDGCHCKDQEKEKDPRDLPESGKDLNDTLAPQVVSELADRLGQLSIAARDECTVSKEVAGTIGKGATVKRMSNGTVPAKGSRKTALTFSRNRTTAGISKAQRLARFRASKLPVRLPARCLADRVRTLLLHIKKASASLHQSSANQHAVTDSYVDTKGGMVCIDITEQAQGQVGGGESVGVAVGSDSQEEIDEVMIGSDVEAEMEVDDETSDGESMDLAQDGVQVASNDAVTQDPMSIDDETTPDSMDTDDQGNRAKVDVEKLHEKIKREKAEVALRQMSTSTASGSVVTFTQPSQQHVTPVSLSETGNTATSMGQGAVQHLTPTNTASGSVVTFQQPSQQHAAPVSLPETGNGASSVGQGVVHHLTSTNSAADLRDARRGKRPEPRAVPEGVEGPSPVPDASTTEAARKPESTQSSPAPSTVPSVGQAGSDGQKSDSTTTPTTTAPTSVSTTPPRSPPTTNTAPTNEFPKPPSIEAEALPGKEQTRKRGRDAPVDSGDNEKSSGEPEDTKAKTYQGDDSTPGSGPSNVSSTRRILPVKRAPKAPTGDTGMRKAQADRTSQEPAPAPASPPMAVGPAAAEEDEEEEEEEGESSSKRTRGNQVGGAGSEETVAPLSDIPDDRGRKWFPPPPSSLSPFLREVIFYEALNGWTKNANTKELQCRTTWPTSSKRRQTRGSILRSPRTATERRSRSMILRHSRLGFRKGNVYI